MVSTGSMEETGTVALIESILTCRRNPRRSPTSSTVVGSATPHRASGMTKALFRATALGRCSLLQSQSTKKPLGIIPRSVNDPIAQARDFTEVLVTFFSYLSCHLAPLLAPCFAQERTLLGRQQALFNISERCHHRRLIFQASTATSRYPRSCFDGSFVS